ncbi:MAG: phosphoglucosamine mutase [Opitutus sp.]
MSRHYFGTDGVRGAHGGPVVNGEFFARLGFAAVAWLRLAGKRGSSDPENRKPAAGRHEEAGNLGRVLIGRDTRGSGASLEAAVACGVRAAGAEPVSLGILPTPAVSRAVRTSGAGLGIMITASHNPAGDNGIKIFGPGGLKLTDEDEELIEGHLGPPIAKLDEGVLAVAGGAIADYISVSQSLLPPGSLAGWRVVLDTANGSTSATSPVVFRGLGAEVTCVGDAPDGTNINAGVGSEHPGVLAARVMSTGARIGVAHDGDGDRCVLCDEGGAVLDGDELLTILALHALATGRLADNTLVVTLQSNLGVDAAVKAAGGRVLRTAIGDRYVIERMRAEGATLGGESSGHIVCSEVSPTGDGLIAALRVIEVMLATGKPLSELRRALRKFPQRTAALRVSAKTPLAMLPTLTSAIRRLESGLGAQGRVLVRYSGTEAKLRLLVEGPTDAVVRDGIARLEAAARADLHVI